MDAESAAAESVSTAKHLLAIGDERRGSGHSEQAIAAYREAIALLEGVNHSTEQVFEGLAEGHHLIAMAQRDLLDPQAARQSLQEARRVCLEWVDAFPDAVANAARRQKRIAATYGNLAETTGDGSFRRQELDVCSEALEHLEKLARRSGMRESVLRLKADVASSLGLHDLASDALDDARDIAEKLRPARESQMAEVGRYIRSEEGSRRCRGALARERLSFELTDELQQEASHHAVTWIGSQGPLERFAVGPVAGRCIQKGIKALFRNFKRQRKARSVPWETEVPQEPVSVRAQPHMVDVVLESLERRDIDVRLEVQRALHERAVRCRHRGGHARPDVATAAVYLIGRVEESIPPLPWMSPSPGGATSEGDHLLYHALEYIHQRSLVDQKGHYSPGVRRWKAELRACLDAFFRQILRVDEAGVEG